MNIGLGVVNFAKAVGFGAWAAVKAAWPGGESPMEAFTRVYDETMASGQGVYTTVSESGVSAEDIDEGEKFTSKNLRVVRPGFGAQPHFYEQLLGFTARRAYSAGTPLKLDELF